MASLRAPIFEEKVVDFIIEMADVKEREVSAEELLRDPDAGEEGATAATANAGKAKKPAAKKAAAPGKAPDKAPDKDKPKAKPKAKVKSAKAKE